MGFIHGRGSIIITWMPTPVEQPRLVDMLRRSSWYKGDLDRLSKHSQQLTFLIDAPEDFESKRIVALLNWWFACRGDFSRLAILVPVSGFIGRRHESWTGRATESRHWAH